MVVLLLASPAFSGEPPVPPRGRIDRTPAFTTKVDDAIERGVAWIRKAQNLTGALPDFEPYPGATSAFAYHTMRVCGVPREDFAARHAWGTFYRAARGAEPATYTAAVGLMALCEHGDRDAGAADDRDTKLNTEDAKWASKLVGSLVRGQRDGGWGYGSARMRVGEDHSNTQYALLGLKCAARCGVAIDPAVWERALQHLCQEQEKDGPQVRRRGPGFFIDRARGWAYHDRDVQRSEDYGNVPMTAGGVSSVVICRSELLGTSEMTPFLAKRSDGAARDGIAWLGRRWFLPPAAADLDLYALYAVERAGVLAAVDWLGDIDWYERGAQALLGAQLEDGSWDGRVVGLEVDTSTAKGPELARVRRLVGTCFALLFLRRGTAPVHRGAVTQTGDELGINFDQAGRLAGRDLDDFLDLVLSKWAAAGDPDVRRRVFDGATSAGPRIVEPLLTRMAAEDVDRRTPAHALLTHATGLDFGWVGTDPAEPRTQALGKWRAWREGAGERLVYDPAVWRLVVR